MNGNNILTKKRRMTMDDHLRLHNSNLQVKKDLGNLYRVRSSLLLLSWLVIGVNFIFLSGVYAIFL